MIPMSNERSRLNFSRFFLILKKYLFLSVLYLFEHHQDPDFREFSKISKIDGFWDRFWGKWVIFFKKLFSELFLKSLAIKMLRPEFVHFWRFKSYNWKRDLKFQIFWFLPHFFKDFEKSKVRCVLKGITHCTIIEN